MFISLAIIFLFGICIGSFLNVVADRLPRNESPWRGRSHCDYCKKTLGIADLIPLVSFLWLGGRCRYCHKKLSWQYPISELTTGIVFALVFSWVSLQFNGFSREFLLVLIASLIGAASLIVIFVADVKYQIIPDEMLITLAVGAMLFHLGMAQDILSFLFSGIIAAVFFLLIYLITRRKGMGFGDVKLVFVLGLLLGFPNIVIALYIAFLTGAALSLILLLAKRKRLKSRIAFGPFLVGGSVISLIFGAQIAQWYLNLFN